MTGDLPSAIGGDEWVITEEDRKAFVRRWLHVGATDTDISEARNTAWPRLEDRRPHRDGLWLTRPGLNILDESTLAPYVVRSDPLGVGSPPYSTTHARVVLQGALLLGCTWAGLVSLLSTPNE